MEENYYEAAVRHYVDGCILEREECYDNTVCLMGISVECVLKCLIGGYLGEDRRKVLKYRYGHSGEFLINDLDLFLANSSMALSLDPALGLKMLEFELPEILFKDHPERRYAEDGRFGSEDAGLCREVANFLVKEMIRQHIDGYI